MRGTSKAVPEGMTETKKEKMEAAETVVKTGEVEGMEERPAVGYVCVDRGGQRCPCHLMEAGQCYTCTMTRTGICSCEDAAGWQGVCPYTEFMQQGRAAVRGEPDRLLEVDVLSKIYYGGGLFVIRLSSPAGFAEACLRPGAFLMIEALGCRTPFSVLRSQRQGRGGFVELAVKAVGPKSSALTGSGGSGNWKADDSEGWKAAGSERWKVAGPYYNGLLGGEKLTTWADEPLLVVARGMAAIPFLAARQLPELAGLRAVLYLDDETLPEPFLEEYLSGQPFSRICLGDKEDRERVSEILTEAVRQEGKSEGKGEGAEKEKQHVMLLTSPYYEDLLTEKMTAEEKGRLVVPNQANLCCALGLCGSCSYTDRDGMTVRLCKCGPNVLE